jgi:hypothetical protein
MHASGDTQHYPEKSFPLPRSKHDPEYALLITAHILIGPAFEIADRELFEEWIGLDELLTRCPAGCVGARQE